MAASSLFPLSLLLLLSLSLLSSPADARICKTLLISYTISSEYYSPVATSSELPSSRFFAVYRIISPRFESRPRFIRPVPSSPSSSTAATATASLSSLHDRAKDIVLVVAGLLFGVGCGAITAATLYLAWSLVTNQYEICGAGDLSDVDDDVESPKKFGYVEISDPKVGFKEGYEMK